MEIMQCGGQCLFPDILRMLQKENSQCNHQATAPLSAIETKFWDLAKPAIVTITDHHGFENKNVHMGLGQEYPWEILKDRIPCLGCLGYIKDIGFGYSQMYRSTNIVGSIQRVNNYYILKEDFSSSKKLVTSWGWTQCHLSLLLPFKGFRWGWLTAAKNVGWCLRICCNEYHSGHLQHGEVEALLMLKSSYH